MDLTRISFLDGLRNQTAESWERLALLYRSWLRHWLVERMQLQEHDADDLVQTVLLEVRDQFPRADFAHNGRVGVFRKWLRGVTHNRLLEAWRKRRTMRERVPWDESHLTYLADPESDLSRQWDREHDDWIIRRGWELLQPRFDDRTLRVVRRLLEAEQQAEPGLSPADRVAQEFGIPRSTVYCYKSRVLCELRHIIQEFLES